MNISYRNILKIVNFVMEKIEKQVIHIIEIKFFKYMLNLKISHKNQTKLKFDIFRDKLDNVTHIPHFVNHLIFFFF